MIVVLIIAAAYLAVKTAKFCTMPKFPAIWHSQDNNVTLINNRSECQFYHNSVNLLRSNLWQIHALSSYIAIIIEGYQV